jgi:hypothetical protein
MPANDFPLAAVLLGWPAVIVSVALVLVGVVRLRAQVALAGAILGCPFLLYLFATPRVGWFSLLVGALYIGSSKAVAQSRRGLAVAMATPFVVLAGFVAGAVLNQ